MYAPLSLNVTVTLIFDLETSNSIGVIQTPCQVRRSLGYDFSSYCSDKVCLWTDGPTDRPTNGPTNMCKAIYRHNKKYTSKKNLLEIIKSCLRIIIFQSFGVIVLVFKVYIRLRITFLRVFLQRR